MSLIKDLITAIRYYNSLDPYHRDVDNRPLNDLGSNQGVMADGLDTGLLSQKVVSAAAGFVARGLLGENMAVGKTEISGWNFKIKRLLAVMNKVASGTDSRLVPELSLWSEQLAPSGAGEGMFTFGQHADKYNIYSIRVTTGQALTTKTPFYDATLSTYFPQVCEVQQASFVLVSSQVSFPPGEPEWAALGAIGSDQLEVIRIVVPPVTLGEASAVTGSMVTHMSYQEEGGEPDPGVYLTVDRAKAYGISAIEEDGADNLVLVNHLPDVDLNLVTSAGIYGIASAAIPTLLNSPMPLHSNQDGTWAGSLEVSPVDAFVMQTLTLSRVVGGVPTEGYMPREIWSRDLSAEGWGAWRRHAMLSDIPAAPSPRELFVFSHNTGAPYAVSSGYDSFSVAHDLIGPAYSLGDPFHEPALTEIDTPSYDVVVTLSLSPLVQQTVVMGGTGSKHGFMLKFEGVLQLGSFIEQDDSSFWGQQAEIRLVYAGGTFTVPLSLSLLSGGWVDDSVVNHIAYAVRADWAVCDVFGGGPIPDEVQAILRFYVASTSDGGDAAVQVVTVEAFNIRCLY